MKFNFDCEEILVCDQNGFSVLEGACHNKIYPEHEKDTRSYKCGDLRGLYSYRIEDVSGIIPSIKRPCS